MTITLSQILHSFFEDNLKLQKGLQPTSIRSYRDTVRLFLCHVAQDQRRRITQIRLQDLTFEQTQRFLQHLEVDRHNHVQTRNQRLCALRTFFDYVAYRVAEMLPTGQQVALIPAKRVHPAETQFMERQELTALFRSLPKQGRHVLRDRTLLSFLTTQALVSRRLSNFAAVILTSAPRHAYNSTVKGISSERVRCARKPRSSFR